MKKKFNNRNLDLVDRIRKIGRGIAASQDYEKVSYEEKITIHEMRMAGKSWSEIAQVLGSSKDDTRMIRGLQRIHQKMRANYGTSEPRQGDKRPLDVWAITMNRSGHDVTKEELKWVTERCRRFPKEMTWLVIALETGRPISEVRVLFKRLKQERHRPF